MHSHLTHSSLSKSNYLRGAGWGIFAISIWVVWIVQTRHSVINHFTVYDIAALRFGLAGLLLLPVLLRKGLPIKRVGWPAFWVMVLGAGAPYVLVSGGGFLYAPAAQGGALAPGTMPLWTAILSSIFLHEKIPRARKLGLALIPVGVVVLLGAGLTDFSSGHWKGQLLFIAGAILWAAFTVALRISKLDALHATAIVAVTSAVIYVPIYWLLLPHDLANIPLHEIVSLTLFQGLVVSVVSLLAYSKAVAILGASLASSFTSLVPVLAMLLAMLTLGENPVSTDVMGIAAITIGVFLASGASNFFRKALI